MRWVALALVAVAVGLPVAAWTAAPSASNLEGRLAARERATGVRRTVPLPQVSLYMREAIVATEDERFFHNHGIDFLGIARAVPYDVAHLSFAQGASTITDQLVKLLYLGGNDHSPWRKLEDLAVSLRVSTRYSKEQVLDAYLNSAYFGASAYGIGAASERYFGTRPARLSLAQASLLAGLVQAPSAYDPLAHPLAARYRQLDVLRSLVRDGYATAAQADRVLSRPLPLRSARPLPPLPGVTVASLPAFALGKLALGLGALAGAVVAFVAARRRLGAHRAVQVGVRAASVIAAVAGAIIVTNSFNAL